MEKTKIEFGGQARKDFYEWLLSRSVLKKHKLFTIFTVSGSNAVKLHYLALPPICQEAIIMEWFDSIGFHIGRDSVKSYWLENSTFYEKLNVHGYEWITKMGSYAEAINEASDSYNRNHALEKELSLEESASK